MPKFFKKPFKKDTWVVWDRLNSLYLKLKRMYGEGPFYVLNIIELLGFSKQKSPRFQSLIISKKEKGEPILQRQKRFSQVSPRAVEFSGDLFLEVSSEDLRNSSTDKANEIDGIITKIVKDEQNKPEGLWKMEEIYCFSLGFHEEERDFSIETAKGFYIKIKEILDGFVKIQDLEKIKSLYDFVKRITKKRSEI